MIKKYGIEILFFVIITVLFMFTYSCKKDEIKNPTVTDIDGNVYHTVTIGTQTWMVENLKTTKFNDGAAIPLIKDGPSWTSIETPAICTYNNTTNTDTINTYGRLYNWYSVNTGKLCPIGWHVPTTQEWGTLFHYLVNSGFNYDGSIGGYDEFGFGKIGKALASKTKWESSLNKGAVGNTDYPEYINKSGFTALPSGYRDDMALVPPFNNSGTFGGIGYMCGWWSSSESNSELADISNLSGSSSGVIIFRLFKGYGFSIRCIKDK